MTVAEKIRVRELEAELAATKAELALAKAAYEGLVAKLGADDLTEITSREEERWLAAWVGKEEAA